MFTLYQAPSVTLTQDAAADDPTSIDNYADLIYKFLRAAPNQKILADILTFAFAAECCCITPTP